MATLESDSCDQVEPSFADPVGELHRDVADYSHAMTYGLFSSFTAQAGKRDDLVGALLRAAELLEHNPGCIQYIVSTSDESNAVYVFEHWTDQGAHDACLEPENIRRLIEQARPLIEAVSGQTQLSVNGGKGMRV
jgi:quinol monooxygenase YgiN